MTLLMNLLLIIRIKEKMIKMFILLLPLIKLVLAAFIIIPFGLVIATIICYRRKFWLIIKEGYRERFN